MVRQSPSDTHDALRVVLVVATRWTRTHYPQPVQAKLFEDSTLLDPDAFVQRGHGLVDPFKTRCGRSGPA